MIKTGDKIGFRRTEYGALEFGVYRGCVDGKFSVEKEDGEMVEMTIESYSGSRWCHKSPMDGMKHHIGWLIAKEDFEHCDRGYECAAWFENMKVEKGGRFPLFARMCTEYNYETNQNIEYGIDQVTAFIDGTVVNDDFGGRFCGVPLGNYDENKNKGKKTDHRINWYGYQFAAIVRGEEGDYRFHDYKLVIPCEIELFDSVYVTSKCRHLDEEDQKFYGTKVRYEAEINILRATDEPLDVQVSKYLQAHEVYSGVYMRGDELLVDVERGDWKHDHGSVRYLVKKFFKVAFGKDVIDNQTVTDENGSDNYSAIHTFSEVK